MRIWPADVRWGVARALTAVCLLAGIFAMHGLTGSHEAAMAVTHQPATTMQQHPETHQNDVPASDHQAAAVTVQPARDGHGHAMGDACLAMLTALALAIIAALALRCLLARYPVEGLVPVSRRPVTQGIPPPWRQPTLSKLCVLRI